MNERHICDHCNHCLKKTVNVDAYWNPGEESTCQHCICCPCYCDECAFNRINRITLAELDAFAYDLHAHLTKAP